MDQKINNDILKVANEAYPDAIIPQSYEHAVSCLRTGPEHPKYPGDLLALFVAVECCEQAVGAKCKEQAFGWASIGLRDAASRLITVADALAIH